jgi:PTH1 family peptidyl-tRNA hydrolase
LKFGGGHGGHNGIRDVAAALGTGDFHRVRVGVGRPSGRKEAADYVLRDFSADERKVLPNLLSDAADAVEQIATEGLTAAQLRFHTAKSE